MRVDYRDEDQPLGWVLNLDTGKDLGPVESFDEEAGTCTYFVLDAAGRFYVDQGTRLVARATVQGKILFIPHQETDLATMS